MFPGFVGGVEIWNLNLIRLNSYNSLADELKPSGVKTVQN